MTENKDKPLKNELLSVLFVTSGTLADRLLYKYPFDHEDTKLKQEKTKSQSPYAVKIAEDYHHNTKGSRRGHILTKKGVIVGLSDQTLALLLGVGSNLLCAEKFNVKIEEVRFVGFPLAVEDDGSQTGHKISSFNIAFALHANCGPWIVSCYQDLAKQLTVALKHEEKRVQYLSTQAKVMSTVHNEVTSLPEDSFESPFETILKKSQLAKQLSQIYDSLNEYGVVHFFLNNWIEINFCLPHRLHYLQTGHKFFKMEPEAIQKCLKSLRPYHGMLLLQEENMLLESLPVDCTPALSRLVQVANPIRSLQKLAVEADLSLFQVFQLVCHLVYWAKAIIIYPLCETNVYVLSPLANTNLASPLAEAFTQQFPGRSLVVEMSEFSFPSQLRKNQNALSHPEVQDLKVRMVVWMLQHHLLIQLHTYIFFVPAVKKKKSKDLNKVHIVPEDWSSTEGGLQRSPSFSDAASVASDESYTLSTPSMMFAQLSKSPSSEFTSDNGPHASDENKMYWMMQESVFANLTKEEKDCIMSVPASKNMDDLRMFARLFPYFSGKSHIEEIMYFENLLRSQLLTLLDKFHEVLILCTYQDPATMLSSSLR